MEWLTADLKQHVRKVFEPQYQRKLTDGEILNLAESLTGVMETILRFKFRKQYEKTKQ